VEILQPKTESLIPQEQHDPTPSTENIPDLKHIEFLSELGIKDQIFNDKVMEKISYIAEKVDIGKFRELSLRVGGSQSSRLDKIYTFMQLSDEYGKLGERQKLIKETLDKRYKNLTE